MDKLTVYSYRASKFESKYFMVMEKKYYPKLLSKFFSELKKYKTSASVAPKNKESIKFWR